MITNRDQIPEGRGLAFGPFLFDPRRRLLWNQGNVVPLTAKAFELLTTLLDHRDQIVNKDDLLKRVWPGTFVQENNLVRHISMLRKALAQRPDQHDYVVTIPGVGYRFVAPVTEADIPAHLPTSVLRSDVAIAAAETTGAPDVSSVTEDGPIAKPAPPVPSTFTATPTAPAAPRVGARYWAIPAASWRLWTAAAVVLIAAGFFGFFLQEGTASAHRSLRQFTYGPDVQFGPAWSPDGRSLAFSSNRSGDFELWVQELDAPAPTQITREAGSDWQPSWSPDGSLLAFRSDGDAPGIYVVSPRGEALRRISPFGYNPTWSPDSRQILFYDERVERILPQSYVVGLDGGPPVKARPDLVAGLAQARTAWHPDGQLTIWGRSPQGWTMIKAPVSSGPATTYVVRDDVADQLTKLNVTLSDFAWAPSGEFVYFEGLAEGITNLWRVAVSPRTLEWRALPERLTTGAGSDGHVAVSPDGRRLAFSTKTYHTRIWAMPLGHGVSGSAESGAPLTNGGSGELDPSVSMDGSVLAYSTVRSGRQEIWTRKMQTPDERLMITGTETRRSQPRVSPDGSTIAYRVTRSVGDQPLISVALLDVNGTERLLTPPGARTLNPDDWSRDGRTLFGTCYDPDDKRFSICSMSIEPNSPVVDVARKSSSDFFSTRLSPNQRWLATVERVAPRDRTWKGAITVLPVGGGPGVPVTEGLWNDEKPRWSATGDVIYFVSNRGGLLNIWGRRFDPIAGQPVGDAFQVTAFDEPHFFIPTDLRQVEVAVTRDRILLPLTDMSSTIWMLEGVDR